MHPLEQLALDQTIHRKPANYRQTAVEGASTLAELCPIRQWDHYVLPTPTLGQLHDNKKEGAK